MHALICSEPRRFVPVMLALAGLTGACADAGESGPPTEEVLSEPGAGVDSGAELKADGAGSTGTPPGTIVRLQVAHGAFPAQGERPNVVVYLPKGFDPAKSLDVIVFLHGFWNCAENVLRPKNGTCAPSKTTHNAYNLANQLEDSKRNAILVVPELALEQASSDPGHLGDENGFYALLDDTLTALGAQVADKGVWDVEHIVVVTHSGGYKAAAGIAAVGGLWVDELYLLDSLYGETERFDAFIRDDPDPFMEAPAIKRFANVYSLGGGTLAAAQKMATRARTWLTDARALLDDRTGATLNTAAYAHGVIFKRSGLAHDDIPRYYFGRLVATSAIPAK